MNPVRIATDGAGFRLPPLAPLALSRRAVAAQLEGELMPRAYRLSQRLMNRADGRGLVDVWAGVAKAADKAWRVADDGRAFLALLDELVIDQLTEIEPAGSC